MEFYQRGKWAVSTPIWIFEGQPPGQQETALTCPHPQWAEASRDIVENPEDGAKYLNVIERCVVCQAIRSRVLPEGIPEEPFDYSIPVTGAWYERLYNLGNFTILVRRYMRDDDQPSFMLRVETPAGHVHTGMLDLDTLLFSPAATVVARELERVIKYGAKRYTDFLILKERLVTKREKEQVQHHVESLSKVGEDIGPESAAAAKSILESEIEQEGAEMEQYEIEAMEREVQYKKESLKRRKPKKAP